MNTLSQLRHTYEVGDLRKQEYIEAIHAHHACLFDYCEFIKGTDVEDLRILPEGIFVRSRSQQIELLLDPEDQHLVPYTLMNFRAYESAETEFCKSVTRANWTILDIGANCGWYSLALSKHCPTVKIHAFEPIPRTYEMLKGNIRHNGFSNIVTHRVAFSNHERILDFLYTPSCSGASSLTKAGQPSENLEKISCPGTTLDLFCTWHELSPQLIKCDVEGAELMVIQGGEETIANHKPVILIELLIKWSRLFGYHPNEVLSLLGKHGYRAHTLSGNSLIPCASINENTPETNFIFLHKKQHESLRGTVGKWLPQRSTNEKDGKKKST